MNCIVTAGPTSEPLDAVRRLTNLSTGRLGSELADYLCFLGHTVVLLRSDTSTYRAETRASEVLAFRTAEELEEQFHALADRKIGAVFHASAVSDFRVGKIWMRSAGGQLAEIIRGKLDTRSGPFLVELVPTRKILSQLRSLFPNAWLIGWKYEVDGDRTSAIASAVTQIGECTTDACVVNGPAYGEGFGFLTKAGELVTVLDSRSLYECLGKLVAEHLNDAGQSRG